MAVLEGAAFGTLVHHADADPSHGEDLWQLIDELPLEPSHVEVMTTTALNTANLHTRAVEELLDDRAPARA